MNNEYWYECYGFLVQVNADPAARPVLDDAFGPTLADPDGHRHAAGPVVRLTVRVDDGDAPAVEPPHNPAVLKADIIMIDAGASRATVDPARWTVEMTLARRDLADPVVWGRWMLERIFLYLVCRSPRHYPMHAGGLQVDGRTALVCGPTGMGKSTFTTWAMRRGATLLGEDIMVRHLDDPPGVFWGYPCAVYLTPELLDGHPQLAQAPRAAVDGGAKYRVTVPVAAHGQTGSLAEVDTTVVLNRGADEIRRIEFDDVVQQWRDDYAAGKDDPDLVAAIEADLRRCLADRPIWELSASSNLDAAYDLVLKTVFAGS
ncbi:hypothetical protein [Micromonospora luteifusca]|uniref:hypothetical protein n=1 Tax=Micromonospora luteifusca TaxID=709860 RepID=UPI0033A93013